MAVIVTRLERRDDGSWAAVSVEDNEGRSQTFDPPATVEGEMTMHFDGENYWLLDGSINLTLIGDLPDTPPTPSD